MVSCINNLNTFHQIITNSINTASVNIIRPYFCNKYTIRNLIIRHFGINKAIKLS